VNGHFVRHVYPLERLRIEKDAEILRLRQIIRALELRTGTPCAQVTQDDIDSMNAEMVGLEFKRDDVLGGIEAAETKLKSLQVIISKFEDRVGEWKLAHEQAVGMISKAEQLRSEYEGMMTTLREEDARVVAKKKELERLQAKCSGGARGNPNAHFERLQAISADMEQAEEESAGKELELQRLKAKKAGQAKLLESENAALEVLRQRIQAVRAERMRLEARVGADEEEEDLDADAMMEDFSNVCV
jgi:chromosome segregation ATPase